MHMKDMTEDQLRALMLKQHEEILRRTGKAEAKRPEKGAEDTYKGRHRS